MKSTPGSQLDVLGPKCGREYVRLIGDDRFEANERKLMTTKERNLQIKAFLKRDFMIAKTSRTSIPQRPEFDQGRATGNERSAQFHGNVKALAQDMLSLYFWYGRCERLQFLAALVRLEEDQEFDLNDARKLTDELRLPDFDRPVTSSIDDVLPLLAKMGGDGRRAWCDAEGVSAPELLAWLGKLPSSAD
jgi:hypothetical protein